MEIVGKDFRNSMSWNYSLTVQEEALCAKIGWERQLKFLGQPERNINYSEGDVWESIQHMICAGSEMAFARMMNIKNFVPSVNTFKSELDIPNFGEIRYGFPPIKGLRITVRDNEELIYVLMADGLCKRTRRKAPDWLGNPYIALGWIFGKEAKNPNWAYNKKTWYVPIDKLRSMNEIPYVKH